MGVAHGYDVLPLWGKASLKSFGEDVPPDQIWRYITRIAFAASFGLRVYPELNPVDQEIVKRLKG
jgi:hypothetical protein